MAENTKGIRAILSHSQVYTFVQDLIGARQARKRFVSEYVKPFPNMRVLDIGCGPGEMAEEFTGVEYVGVDHSENYIEQAKQQHSHQGEFYCTDVNELNTPVKKFDCAIAFGVLHHLDDQEAIKLFSSLKSWLKPGGRFITYDPTLCKNMNPMARFLVTRDRGQNVRTEDELKSILHKHFSSTETHVHFDFLKIPYASVVSVNEI